jgi:hypothetical protein
LDAPIRVLSAHALQTGHDITNVVRGGAKRLIAPAEEVLALKPELHLAA